MKEFITVVVGATVSSWQNVGSTWESQSSVLIPSGRLKNVVPFDKGAATSSWGKYPLQLPQLGQEDDIYPQPSYLTSCVFSECGTKASHQAAGFLEPRLQRQKAVAS